MGRANPYPLTPIKQYCVGDSKYVHKLGRIRKSSMFFCIKTTWTRRHFFGTLPRLNLLEKKLPKIFLLKANRRGSS